MKVWEIVIEDADGMGAGAVASIAMPLFTGKKGKAHHKAARRAVGLEGKDANVQDPATTMIRRVK